MLALVRHHMISSLLMGPGGSEYVSIETAIALRKAGFEVYLDSITVRSPDKLGQLIEFYGLPRDETVNIGLGYPPDEPDIVVNTSGDVLSGKSHIIYLHYPSFLDVDASYPALKGFARTIGNIYALLNNVLFPLFIKTTKVFIANSSLTAWFFHSIYGIKPIVIYPPVNLDDIITEQPLPYNEREPNILIVSRFSPEKNLDQALELASLIKKRRLGFKIVIAGSLSEYNGWYLDKFIREIRRGSLEDVISIKVNLPRRELVELFKTSLIYVHLTPMEHFGISIVEAMSAGTPPIVPKYSGAWIDIANENENIALPYTSIEELIRNIELLAKNKETWDRLSRNSRTRSLAFSRHRYHREIEKILRDLGYSRKS
ncbi:glycosyltransferase family 4 protein [Thermogladius sp. 4427co]|uniref:glycosyltransferase family 4 protein n=1 Tax=Thermogladius sp. 4427co TaxID=3450718 RepID=UPI003F7AECA6